MKDHPQLIEMFVQAYSKRWGRKYLFSGAKDGVAAKRLLTTGTPEQVMATIKAAWDHDGWWCQRHTATLASIASAWNQIRQELRKPKPTIQEIRAVLAIKQRRCDELKARHRAECAGGTVHWDNEHARLEFLKLREEIKGLQGTLCENLNKVRS